MMLFRRPSNDKIKNLITTITYILEHNKKMSFRE